MIGDTDVALVLGMRGVGKTTLTKNLSEIFPRKLIFDRLLEYSGDIILTGSQEFKAWWEKNHERENFCAVIRFKQGIDAESLTADFDEVLRVIYQCEFYKNSRGITSRTGIIIEELQNYCSPQGIAPFLLETLHTGRHAGIAILGNTQRPALIHSSFFSLSSHIFVGRLFSDRDTEKLRSSGFGSAAIQAPSLNPGEFLYCAPGQEPLKIKSVFL